MSDQSKPNKIIKSPAPPDQNNLGKLEYHQIELLDDAARACDVVADFVRSGISRVGRPTDASANDLKGFSSAGQLRALVDSWHSNGRSLADRIEGFSPRLTKTAAAYRSTEENIKNEINKVWKVRN